MESRTIYSGSHSQDSLILFQVNVPSVPATRFKRYTPLGVHVDTITPRFAHQGMEVEARDFEIAQRHGAFERVQSPDPAVVEIRRQLTTSAIAKQFFKALMAELPS
jgi:hypothetical protein